MIQLFILLYAFFVQFTDKVGSEQIALSEQALDKRAERGIEIDMLDYAVSPIYLDSLRSVGCHIYHSSRWMNGATIETDSNTIQAIQQWAFVESVEVTRCGDEEPGTRSQDKLQAMRREGEEAMRQGAAMVDKAWQQKEQINLNKLHEAGFHGQGITMAIIDAGFYNVNTLAAFDSVRTQILGIYDMTDDTDSITGETGSHGVKCFSTIAAITPNYIGTATAANYYLIRSEEIYTESLKELDNWVAAIELADSLGVDIASTSLGYSMFDDERFDFSYQDIDGKSNRATQAARIATRKGMLVVIAAGNEGNKDWHYISVPADADSILTVGAVDSNGNIAAFSSWGPTADGRVKPEVCATGYQTALLNPTDNSLTNSNGTSFACPIIAGMAACLWSALPDATNMEIRERIIESAHRYHFPHDQYGYGIPDAWEAYQNQQGATLEETITYDKHKAHITYHNGQLVIKRNNTYYNLLGTPIITNLQ